MKGGRRGFGGHRLRVKTWVDLARERHELELLTGIGPDILSSILGKPARKQLDDTVGSIPFT